MASKVRASQYSEKQRIGKIALFILIAFCVQFIIYIFLMNVLPVGKDIDGDGRISNVQSGEINSFFYEVWDDRQDDGVMNYHINSIQFIHSYNLIILVVVLMLLVYYAIVFLDENKGKCKLKIKEYFKNNKGLFLLICFIGWTFISSCFAYDKFRSFIGCHNLRDGLLSFMSYGAILVCMLLASNINTVQQNKRNKNISIKTINYKKIIVYLFLAVTALITVISIGNYNAVYKGEAFPITINRLGVSKVNVTCGIFNNSNHYAYLLSISVIAAIAMFVKEKNIGLKIFSVICFMVMTYMLIINDTFGAYLGVMISLICMVIHSILCFIFSSIDDHNTVKDSKEENEDYNSGVTSSALQLIYTLIAFAIFALFSFVVKNPDGDYIVKNNFNYISDSIKIIFASNSDNEEIEADSNVNVGTNITEENVENDSISASKEADEAGSGRWGLWVGATEIIKKHPILGCGPENMLFEYAKLGINEGRSHNLILQLAGTTGIPGMLMYVVGIILIFFKGLKNWRNLDAYTYTGIFVMISYLISSLTGNSAFYTSGYFYIFVALVILGSTKENTSNDKKV